MVEINRVWLNVDTDTNKITLFSRPCVSIHVDEYIWSLIEEHSVEFKRIKETTQMWSLNIRSHGDRFYPLPVH